MDKILIGRSCICCDRKLKIEYEYYLRCCKNPDEKNVEWDRIETIIYKKISN